MFLRKSAEVYRVANISLMALFGLKILVSKENIALLTLKKNLNQMRYKIFEKR